MSLQFTLLFISTSFPTSHSVPTPDTPILMSWRFLTPKLHKYPLRFFSSSVPVWVKAYGLLFSKSKLIECRLCYSYYCKCQNCSSQTILWEDGIKWTDQLPVLFLCVLGILTQVEQCWAPLHTGIFPDRLKNCSSKASAKEGRQV